MKIGDKNEETKKKLKKHERNRKLVNKTVDR